MNQFGQMGMQGVGPRSTPPLPMGGPLNQVGYMFVLIKLMHHFIKCLVRHPGVDKRNFLFVCLLITFSQAAHLKS